ncbi:MAG TPA: ABC transporter permease [Gemmatimonadaceae bacterium]|nr:ABC transporter permease [Gemmatimonadaceae bacterium]
MRRFRQAKMVSVIAVLTLTLGVGANAAVSAVLASVLLRAPAGVTAAGELRRVTQRFVVPLTHERRERDIFSLSEVTQMSQGMPPGVSAAPYVDDEQTTDDDLRAQIKCTFVAGDYFGVLGVTAALGRLFHSDGPIGPVAVISERLWETRFGHSPQLLGQHLQIAGKRFAVIGVAGKGFRGVGTWHTDVWIPFAYWPDSAAAASKPYDLRFHYIARAPDRRITPALAAALTRSLRWADVVGDATATANLTPVTRLLEPQQGSVVINVLTRFQIAAATILLITIANLSNLLVFQSSYRGKQLAIRSALGAPRHRLVQELAFEYVILGIVSGVASIALGGAAATWLRNRLIPGIDWSGSPIDLRLCGLTLGIGLVAGLLSGVSPLLQLRSPRLNLVLMGTKTDDARERTRLRSVMLALQSALLVVLLAVSALFVRSLRNVRSSNTGYAIDELVVAYVEPGATTSVSEERFKTLSSEAAARLRALPQVAAVATAASPPLASAMYSTVFPYKGLDARMGRRTDLSVVSPGFFRAVGLKMVSGRDFDSTDQSGSLPVAIVSVMLARDLWHNTKPANNCVVIGGPSEECRTIVGLVDDVHSQKLLESSSPHIYLPLNQVRGFAGAPRAVIVTMKHGASASDVQLIRQVASWRSSSITWNVKSLLQVLEPELRPWRISALLFASMAVLAVIVAGAGMFGSIAYVTTRRTREIGVRRAFGANSQHIVRSLLTEFARTIGVGLLFGLGGALVVGKTIQSSLYGIEPYDPLTLAVTFTVLIAVAAVACISPIWRALRISPASALLLD